jgi:class 3 adenylate cyclase
MVGKLNFPSGPEQEIDWFSEYHVRSESPGAAEQYFRFVAGIDVREELSRLTMPVLVLHRRGDQLIPLRAARSAASRVPDVRFIELEGDRHLLAAGDSSALAVITAFLAGRNVADSLHRPMPMRTILFTDLIAHTETMQRLGDDRGREFLRKHEDLTRALLAEHGGEEIKTMGDGFLASFSSVTAGVGCAIALQRAVASRNAWLPAPRIDAGFSRDPALEPLHIRVGLNAGEPIEDEGPDGRRDLYGSAVILAARIAAQAEGGQILASNVVRELCSGKPFLFSDRGDHVMKGFDEAIRVYEVRWQN